jgi:hypothetical protein
MSRHISDSPGSNRPMIDASDCANLRAGTAEEHLVG